MQLHRTALFLLISISSLTSVGRTDESAPTEFSAGELEYFEKKIRPLLINRCYECHGPEEQEGSLRLDSRAAILKGGDTGPAIIPGQPDKSEMIAALKHDPDGYQMPPEGKLPAEEIALLTTWVKKGAPWPDEMVTPGTVEEEFDLEERAKHWSFQPVSKPSLPEIKNADWPLSGIDHYILHELEQAGLAPNQETDKRTWLRRVTFDLIGLPPTASEIDQFLNDDSPQAYERVVDRLLESSQFGVRWGRHWLDLVRFAETYGHEFDYNIPFAWRYRDYVIRAFNQDLPYDQLVREHIAGDLMSVPRRDPVSHNNESAVATSFYWMSQGKHSPVDIRAEECDTVDNQIDVLSKTFLGLTVSCARCHDHKFDPITTRDYYALAGYLQSSRQEYRIINDTPDVQKQLQKLRKLSHETGPEITREILEQFNQQLDTNRDEFLTTINEIDADQASENSRISESDDIRMFHPSNSTSWLSSGWAFNEQPQPGQIILGEEGWSLSTGTTIDSGQYGDQLQGALRSHTFLIQHKYIFYRAKRTGPNPTSRRGFKDGQLNLIIDGFQIIKRPLYGHLSLNIPSDGKYHWLKQDVSKFLDSNAYIEIIDEDGGRIELDQVVFTDLPELEIKDKASKKLTIDQVQAVISKYLQKQPLSRTEYDQLNQVLGAADELSSESLIVRIKQFRNTVSEVTKSVPAPQRSIAIAEGTAENEHVLVRGNHKKVGNLVPRRFLEVFHAAQVNEQERGSGRRELAEQIAAEENPFTARVMVNRIWLYLFGRGIVPTPDNFGVLGQQPTHPELLDHLAVQFVEQGWSIKKMIKAMVLSRTYRMSSELADVKTEEADPQNNLWHRMPIKRLEGEIVRDSILAVSGKLDVNLYGPGIAPYLTPFMEGRGRPKKSGPLDGNGRRSIFLNVRRNFLNPLFLAFDYPTPMTTTGRRSISNVPAQALTMMNNPFVVEQAAHWVDLSFAENQHISQEDRIQRMYLRAFGRDASPDEIAQGEQFLMSQKSEYQGEPDLDRQVWNDYAHVLFNLKEFIFIR